MSGMLNKLKEAIVGEPAENTNIAATSAGRDGRDTYKSGSHGGVGSEYSSTNTSGLGSNTGSGMRGDTERSHQGLSSGVEGSRLTNMGGLGQVGNETGSGVGTGFPGSTGHTGSTDKYGDGIDSNTSKPGVAGLEHHGQHGGGLTGSTGRHERERELESGAIGSGFSSGQNTRSGEYSGAGLTGTGTSGSGFASGEQARSGEYSGAGMTGTGGTGGSHLTRADIESRIEPHRHENENFDQYATPSQFSHGKHHGVGQTGTTGEFGSNTTGTGTTGIGSGMGRSSGTGNEYSSSGRNDPYDDNQTGSNTGSGIAPHKSSLLNKLDPRVDNNQGGRNL